MIFKKYFLLMLVTAATAGMLSSCNNSSTTPALSLEQTEVKQPVSQPLQFSKSIHFDFAAIKPGTISVTTNDFDLSKLPSKPYDSVLFKPFTQPVIERPFNFDSLPHKDFDINKIPSTPIECKTYLLPVPRLIKTNLPRLRKSSDPFTYDFGQEQGLLGKIVQTLKDYNGFIWILTEQNLYRYDGENLLLYLTLEQPHNSMALDSQNRIWLNKTDQIKVLDFNAGIVKVIDVRAAFNADYAMDIFMDQQHRIWVTLQSGIALINAKVDACQLISKKQGLLSKITYQTRQDSAGRMWMLTLGNTIQVIDLKAKKITFVDKVNWAAADTTFAITCDPKGRIWLGDRHGMINMLDLKKNTITTINELKGNVSYISNIMADIPGFIWVSNIKGVDVMDLEKRTIRHIGDSYVPNIIRDQTGQTWITTAKGLNIINQNQSIIQHINNMSTTAICEDKHGLIWQASTYNGVAILDRKSKTVRYFTKKNGLSSDSLQTIKLINGSIFVCTNGGLEILDSTQKKITHIKQARTDVVFQAVAIDKKGRLWMGSGGAGVEVYDPQTNVIKEIGKKQGFMDEVIVDFREDRAGNMWTSTYKGGISKINIEKGTIEHLSNVQGLNTYPKTFEIDPEGNIWFSSELGVFKTDVKRNRLLSLSGSRTSNEIIASILQLTGNIYLGEFSGVEMITPVQNGEHEQWKIRRFAINKFNRGFFGTDAISRDGLYWWGDLGITVLDPAKKLDFNPKVHISGIHIMDTARYFTSRYRYNLRSKDTLWDISGIRFVTGTTAFGTSGLAPEKFKYDGVSGPYNLPVNLNLPYHQNYMQFSFAAFGPVGTDSTMYRYILSGADKSWSEPVSTTLSHSYYGLAPGKYVFKVTAKRNGNPWCKPAEFSFTITPPWWATWWAYLLYIVLFAGLVWALVRYRSHRLMTENRVLEHKVKIRTEEVIQQKEEIEAQRDHLEKAVKDLKLTQSQLIQSEKMASLGELTAGIAHEIQNPLNFVNNFSEVSMELIDEMQEELLHGDKDEAVDISNSIKQNLEKIRHHGRRADGIVKGMLQHSRASSHTKETTDLNKLADEYLRLAYHGLRAKDKSFNAELIMHFDKNLPEIQAVPQDIGRVLLNMFTNAFYATQQKQKSGAVDYKPTVTLTTEAPPGAGEGAKFVRITVRDNGMGIPDSVKDKIMQPFFTTKPTGEGTGLGLSLSYDIVVKGHGGTIDINSQEGEFSEFTIRLPASL